MIRWCIYYDDGRTYTDTDGPLEYAPGWGVLVVVDRDAVTGYRLITNCDYMVWEARGATAHWWEANQMGLLDYLARPGWKKVLVGRLVENAHYQRVYDAAYALRLALIAELKPGAKP